jgi:hypothetical protein
VAAYSGRLNIIWKNINLFSEAAWKINDPNRGNEYIYKIGNAFVINGTYAVKGIGIELACQRVDNFDFRSEREAVFNESMINSIPEMTQMQTYALMAKYPFASQPEGEMGWKANITYNLKKETRLGGRYGTLLALTYSRINNIDKQYLPNNASMEGTIGYTSDFLKIGNPLFYQEAGLKAERKVSPSFKFVVSYLNQIYNYALLREGISDKVSTRYLDEEFNLKDGMVYSSEVVAEASFRLSTNHFLTLEVQNLFTRQDQKNWLFLQAEYSLNHFIVLTVLDNFNYGTTGEHYYFTQITFVKGTGRLSMGFGRQNAGIYCVGGICRFVPATNGLNLSISKSF